MQLAHYTFLAIKIIGFICTEMRKLVIERIERNLQDFHIIQSQRIGLFFIGSVQLFFVGIVGEYIGAIHTQVLRRPPVVERERINFEDAVSHEGHSGMQRIGR